MVPSKADRGRIRPLEQHGAMLGGPLPGARGRGESLGPHLHSASGTLQPGGTVLQLELWDPPSWLC